MSEFPMTYDQLIDCALEELREVMQNERWSRRYGYLIRCADALSEAKNYADAAEAEAAR